MRTAGARPPYTPARQHARPGAVYALRQRRLQINSVEFLRAQFFSDAWPWRQEAIQAFLIFIDVVAKMVVLIKAGLRLQVRHEAPAGHLIATGNRLDVLVCQA